MKVEGLLNPRTWLSGLSLALLLIGTGCGSEAPNAGTQEAPTEETSTQEAALGRPNFQAPFACGQSWTYSHHSAEVRRALDFVMNGGITNGQPQFASAAGYATRHYEAGGAGNYIAIDHGGGWKTYYFHLSAYSVPNGTQVAQGQQIGVTGSTGASSGAHIHYEQLLNGVGQDIVLNGVSLAPYPGSYGSRSITSNNCPCVIMGDIKAKYDAVNGPVLLGKCQVGELATPDGVGRYNHFERGSIYWTPTLGAHVVMGLIRTKWEQLGWERSVVGYPITDELATPDGVGRFNHFERGSIYWTQNTGAWEIHGNIRAKWEQLGWEKSHLGYPTTGELATPDGVGRYNHFQNGSIYWTQATGAHEVRGLIHAKWAELGWEKSYLGYPVTDEQVAADGVGHYNHFERGSIYFTPATGAHEVLGDINAKWIALGREAGLLGYPLTDETKTPDGVGRFNHFQNGSIYWTATTGAHEVHGPIRAKWESLGWETGSLGYPVKDEYAVTGGRESEFQRGFLTLNTATNTVTVRMK